MAKNQEERKKEVIVKKERKKRVGPNNCLRIASLLAKTKKRMIKSKEKLKF